MLESSHCEARVHDQNTGLGRPDRSDLALLHDQHQFTTILPVLDIRRREASDVEVGWKEVRLGVCDDVDGDDDDEVCAKGKSHD